MKQWIVTGVLAAVVAGAGRPIEDDGRTRVELVGLGVIKPLAADEQKQSLTGRRTGTALTVKVTRRDKHWLGLDQGASQLVAFTDDRGTELVSDSARTLRTWIDGQTWVSDDGRTCVFEVLAMRTPAPRARQVKLKAKIGLKFGRNAMTAEQADLRLVKDSRLKAGPADMKITGVQRGDKTTIFTFTTKKQPERIGRLQFFDDDGKEYETKVLEKTIVGFMGETYYDWTYALKTDKPRRIDSVTARVLYFSKVQTIVVPVDISAGVGL